MLRPRLASQVKIAIELREQIKGLVSPEQHAKLHAELEQQRDEQQRVSDLLKATEVQLEDTQEHEAELLQQLKDSEIALKGDGRSRASLAAPQLKQIKIETGIKVKEAAVPPRSRPPGGGAHWEKQSIRHMAKTLEGRGEGEDINLVAEALHRTGYLHPLVDAVRFQPIAKSLARRVVAKVQRHWTARHAVHIWDRLEISRRMMETLRHLLSFIYNPVTDTYDPIHAWTNPADSSDFVPVATLAARYAREKEYEKIAAEMNITVGANGRCERDAIEATSRLYSNYAECLRDAYTHERPAQPILYLDGTGGSLGRGICHGEIGCADFKKVGDVEAKQSRATLQPLFLYEGNDHAAPLRENLDLAITSFNKLIDAGAFDRVSLAGTAETLPARPITVADMQGAKSTYGMFECCHSVWCKCKNGEADAAHHAFSSPKGTWQEVCDYCDEIGCEMKTYDEMCSWAHYSPGAARGGAFTQFECSCCSYKPTEKQWRADLKKWHSMSDEDRAAAQKAHMDSGDPLRRQKQHYHQMLFTPPLPHLGMERCGVDNLHLIYLNVFKHLFKYTVHEGLPESKKRLISQYLADVHFYSYDAASLDDDPCSHWIGREVKRFIAEAHLHLPFLLQIAAAPADCCAEMAECANDEGEQEMEYDPEYAPTDKDVEEEEGLLPTMMADAARWDRFLDYVRATQVEWPQDERDTDLYRQTRALEAFNLGNAVAIDVHELKPTMMTWVPHILCFIVPRQMVLLGDPTRRSADACEAFGAMTKKIIKHLTCRRRVSDERTSHGAKSKVAGGADRCWTQTFKIGFIEQAFKRTCVRESLVHGEANAAYGQRRDRLRRTTGRVCRVERKFQSTTESPIPQMSVYQACEERRAQMQGAQA